MHMELKFSLFLTVKLSKTGRRNIRLLSWFRAGSEAVRCAPTSGTVCTNYSKAEINQHVQLFQVPRAIMCTGHLLSYQFLGCCPTFGEGNLMLALSHNYPTSKASQMALRDKCHLNFVLLSHSEKWISLFLYLLLSFDPSTILRGQQTNVQTVG